jgi:hypothetical protein
MYSLIVAVVASIISANSVYGQPNNNNSDNLILEITDVSKDPKVTQIQISGDNKTICKSGNCQVELEQDKQIMISLPTPDIPSISITMDLKIHDSVTHKDLSGTKKAFLEQWVLGVTCGVTDIKDTDPNNLIYECNSDYVTLWPEMKMEDQYFYVIKNAQYFKGEDKFIVTGEFNGKNPYRY